jgi:hypothetical protein
MLCSVILSYLSCCFIEGVLNIRDMAAEKYSRLIGIILCLQFITWVKESRFCVQSLNAFFLLSSLFLFIHSWLHQCNPDQHGMLTKLLVITFTLSLGSPSFGTVRPDQPPLPSTPVYQRHWDTEHMYHWMCNIFSYKSRESLSLDNLTFSSRGEILLHSSKEFHNSVLKVSHIQTLGLPVVLTLWTSRTAQCKAVFPNGGPENRYRYTAQCTKVSAL